MDHRRVDVAADLANESHGTLQLGDGSTRVKASFEGKGPTKSTVAVAHERLPDPDEAETAKAAWRKRLSDLKSSLES